jgi:hypothetical protein
MALNLTLKAFSLFGYNILSLAEPFIAFFCIRVFYHSAQRSASWVIALMTIFSYLLYDLSLYAFLRW